MKNKKLLYVLIPLVLIIWGLIFYQIFKQSGNNGRFSGINTSLKTINNSDDTIDSFQIIANYRDPFLNGYQPQVVKNMYSGEKHIAVRESSTEIVSKTPIVIPELKYFGMIINTKNNKKVGFFQLNNKDLILKEGDLQDDFKIMFLFNDSVKIIYKTIPKTFRKNSKQS